MNVKELASNERTASECCITVVQYLLPPRRGQPLYKGRACLSTRDKGPVPNLSLVERLHCIRDKGPVPNLSLVERLHCIRDKGPVPNLSLVERLHCIRDKGPVPNLSLVERLHCIRDKGPVPNLSLVERLHCTVGNTNMEKRTHFSCFWQQVKD